MNLTAAAIRNDRVTWLALAVVILSGYSAYRALPRAEDPGFTVRTALVRTYFPGASPERVELLVTDKLEKRIQEMPEVDFLSSESRTGVSYVFVNVRAQYTEMRPIWDRLRRKTEAAQTPRTRRPSTRAPTRTAWPAGAPRPKTADDAAEESSRPRTTSYAGPRGARTASARVGRRPRGCPAR